MTPFILIVALTLLAADWSQTTYIAMHPERFYEKNPILGKHPSVLKVAGYFTVCAWLLIMGTAMLPTPYGLALAAGTAVLELVMVVRNHKLGIKFHFQESENG